MKTPVGYGRTAAAAMPLLVAPLVLVLAAPATATLPKGWQPHQNFSSEILQEFMEATEPVGVAGDPDYTAAQTGRDRVREAPRHGKYGWHDAGMGPTLALVGFRHGEGV